MKNRITMRVLEMLMYFEICKVYIIFQQNDNKLDLNILNKLQKDAFKFYGLDYFKDEEQAKDLMTKLQNLAKDMYFFKRPKWVAKQMELIEKDWNNLNRDRLTKFKNHMNKKEEIINETISTRRRNNY